MVCTKLLLSNADKGRKLLKYVRTNDVKRMEHLIFHNFDLLSFEFPHPYDNQKIFIIACNDHFSMETVTAATITRLIELGSNYVEISKNEHWEALHYTALNANVEKMKVIVNYLSPKELNSLVYCPNHIPTKYKFCPSKDIRKSYSNNALSILLKYGNRRKNFYECCELLVKAGINIDQKDSNGISPRNLIKSMNDSNLIELLKLSKEYEDSTEIFDLIKMNDEAQFLTLELMEKQVNSFDGIEEQYSSCTLLQLCCAKGLTSSVNHLLKQNANPNKTTLKSPNSPLMIAIKEDHQDIVNLILQNQNLILPQDILIKLQLKYKSTKNFTRIDKYMEAIFQHLRHLDSATIQNYLLSKDELSRTALHYATYYKCSENILELLQLGASLTERDLFGYTPLNSIEPTLLEKFFDHCIDIPKDDDDLQNMLYSLRNKKYEFTIEINFKSLIAKNETEKGYESEFLGHMIKLKNLTYLMNHPIIASYLTVKWQKFKWVIYINLLMYLIAYGALLVYGFIFTLQSKIANILLLTSLLLLGIHEFVQMMIFRTDYIKRLDNIIDLFLISGIIYIIASGWFENLLNQNLLVAFSVVFLMSTLGIFMQLGHLPFFNLKVTILKQISLNFCKYMLFYMFPLLGFSFCFYMLGETKENLFFQTLYDTITMFAGAPDSTYPERFITNPIFSHIIYVVFVLLIGIILQNLLIGLAVSDLQEIQKEAEFMDKKERAKYITSIEKIIFEKYKKSGNLVSRRIFKMLLNACQVFHDECVLVIQPYNNGCVYVKRNQSNMYYIKDKNIITFLQNIFKDLTMKNKNIEEPYSMKTLHETLYNIQNLLQNLNEKLDKLNR